jgi:hypothetical protein
LYHSNLCSRVIKRRERERVRVGFWQEEWRSALEATHGANRWFLLSYKCYLEEVASVRD